MALLDSYWLASSSVIFSIIKQPKNSSEYVLEMRPTSPRSLRHFPACNQCLRSIAYKFSEKARYFPEFTLLVLPNIRMFVEELLICFVFYISLKIDYVWDNSKKLQMIHLLVNA
jgi:hypothetical protein